MILNKPEKLESINLQSDGSPVTGTELQGQILEVIMKEPRVCKTIVMPGTALEYGQYGLMSKIIAFLWSLFLLVGPWEYGLRFILNMIASVTTDMGTEHRFIDAPDVLKAFLLHIGGASWETVLAAIDYGAKLLPFALRISGWSHCYGNIMKFCCKQIEQWPVILRKL